jgi:hypothetical protein
LPFGRFSFRKNSGTAPKGRAFNHRPEIPLDIFCPEATGSFVKVTLGPNEYIVLQLDAVPELDAGFQLPP